MKKLWIYTTMVVGFQCIVVSGVYAITGDFRTASISATIVVFVAFVADFFFFTFTSRDLAFIIPATCAAAIAVLALRTATSSVVSTVALLVLVGLITAVASNTAKDEGAKEPLWALWLTALPGVGTIWGIGFFSTRFLRDLFRRQNREISA